VEEEAEGSEEVVAAAEVVADAKEGEGGKL